MSERIESSSGGEHREEVPQIARVRTLLFGMGPIGARWDAGVRSVAAFLIPAVALLVTGHSGTALFASFGAFAVLYGEGRPYRVRWAVVLTAGAALLASAAIGVLLGDMLGSGFFARGIEFAVLILLAMAAVYVIDATRLGPPGALFFVLVCAGAAGAVAGGVSGAAILVATLLGVGGSLLASMAGVLSDPGRPERIAVETAVRAVDAYAQAQQQGRADTMARHTAGEAIANAWAAVYDSGPIAPAAPRTRSGGDPGHTPRMRLVDELLAAHHTLSVAAQRDPAELAAGERIPLARPTVWYRLRRPLSLDSHAVITAVRVGIACAAAALVGGVLGSTRPHWALLAALIVLQAGPDRIRGQVRAIQRLAGTAVGLGVFAILMQLSLTGYALVAVFAVLLFGIELFVAGNYAVAAVFITPIALLAGGASTSGELLATVMSDRLIETAVGVIVAVLALHFVLTHAHRRTFSWSEHRIRSAAHTLIDILRTRPIDASTTELRRDLQYELTGGMRAGLDSLHNDPRWTQPRWPPHAALIRDGYDFLGACWTVPNGARLPDIGKWDRLFRAPE
ncbi:FUSC family protein [Nocardia huaxiensis]|uniref:FUSC family protein n=1 Tax=Nocardia huaxiensis TaxID=2755382 RepID=A0A7D6V6X2_9NOCA|nr:FUSC family protein [Nocardia huaxiensis]QLY27673.1 FUSC family protein [Nocardia huaxiensis]